MLLGVLPSPEHPSPVSEVGYVQLPVHCYPYQEYSCGAEKYVGDFIYFYVENTKVPPTTTQCKALFLKNNTEVGGRKEVLGAVNETKPLWQYPGHLLCIRDISTLASV